MNNNMNSMSDDTPIEGEGFLRELEEMEDTIDGAHPTEWACTGESPTTGLPSGEPKVRSEEPCYPDYPPESACADKSQAFRSVELLEDETASWRNRQFPGYVPRGWELEDIARGLLENYFVNEMHSFLNGYDILYDGACDEDFRHFGEIAHVLGNEARLEIVDDVEVRMKKRYGDPWEAYKFTFRPGCFSTHADPEAILRLADDIPEGMWQEAGHQYSDAYVSVLQQVKYAFLKGLPELPSYDRCFRDLEEEDDS